MFTRCLVLIALCQLVMLAACDDAQLGPVAPGRPSSAMSPISVNATWQNPVPFGNDLYRMAGFGDGSFVAVGDAGTIVHYSGGTWTRDNSPAHADLHGVWANGPTDIYACGLQGTLLHFTGSQWQVVSIPTAQDLYGVWVASDGTLFVSGNGGTVWRKQGGTWQSFLLRLGERFRSVCGNSSTDVYAGGSNGFLYHFNGTSWTQLLVFGDPAYDTEIMDMWAPGPGKIAFVDRFNVIWFDGVDWQATNVLDENAYGIFGLSLQQQVAVSAGSSTQVTNGAATRFLMPADQPYFDVWGLSATNYYAVGRYGSLAHFNGSSWQALGQGTIDDIKDAYATSGRALAVGQYGTVLRQTGSQWNAQSVGSNYDLSGVWTDGSFDVAVGRYSPDGVNWREALLTSNGGSWTDVGQIGSAPRLFDVWGTSPGDIYAVGWSGEILRQDSTSWYVANREQPNVAYLRSISGSASNNAIGVGRGNDGHAVVSRFNGVSWATSTLTDVEELYGVWVAAANYAVAVGTSGEIRRFDGAQWKSMPSPTTLPLFCVWGTSPSDIYAGGVDGILIHYDGSCWRRLIIASNRTINGTAGRSASEVYFFGDKGSILRFQGL